MAYDQVAHGNNLVLAYKMDLMNVECIVCNEKHEMQVLKENLSETDIRQRVVAGIRFSVLKIY